MNVETIENGVKITLLNKDNYTLAELKQKLVNTLYENAGHLEEYDNEIELLKNILDYQIDYQK